MALQRKHLVWAGAGVAVLALAGLVGVLVLTRAPKAEGQGPTGAPEAKGPTFTVVHPRRDPSVVVSVQQLLSVDPYVLADLRAQVAGRVKHVWKDVGEPVRKGDVLIEIDVPDLELAVKEKEAIKEQRKRDVDLARAQRDNALRLVDVYREAVDQRKAEVGQAEATQDYRRKRWNRFVTLNKGEGISQNMVDEEERDYRAAVFAVQGANAAVRRADADLKEKQSAVEVAEADIKLKDALFAVADTDLKRTQALFGYTTIQAPFDGVVARRRVDEGSFVQNASTGASEPLMTIARTDVVTAVMQVPDNAVPFLKPGAEAVLQLDDLPGLVIRGQVTRMDPLIRTRDRTLGVYVDLYNDSPENYDRLLARGRAAWGKEARSPADPFPILPTVNGRKDAPRLRPGMSGYMRLQLVHDDSYLLPSRAVFNRGGKPYILLVDAVGKARLTPVRVQFNFGATARVAVIRGEADPDRFISEELRELTGEDTVVLERQTEIADGQTIATDLKADWQKGT
jgi:multidrug resistance efflux pump